VRRRSTNQQFYDVFADMSLDEQEIALKLLTYEHHQATRRARRKPATPEAQGVLSIERATCPDCEQARRQAYSDATTPGFFHDTCLKHRAALGAGEKASEAADFGTRFEAMGRTDPETTIEKGKQE